MTKMASWPQRLTGKKKKSKKKRSSEEICNGSDQIAHLRWPTPVRHPLSCRPLNSFRMLHVPEPQCHRWTRELLVWRMLGLSLLAPVVVWVLGDTELVGMVLLLLRLLLVL